MTNYTGKLHHEDNSVFETSQPKNFIATRSELERNLRPGTRLKRTLEMDSVIEYEMLDRDDRRVGWAEVLEVNDGTHTS